MSGKAQGDWQVVFFGPESERGALAEALSGIAEVVPADAAWKEATLARFDVKLLFLAAPFEEGFRAFARHRAEVPSIPIVIVARGLDVNHAVELLKLGAVDYLELPGPAGALGGKIERALKGTRQPAFASPLFDAMVEHPPSDLPGGGQRRCFRARVLDGYPAYAHLKVASGLLRLRIEDLSVLTAGAPGGLRLLAPTTVVNELPLEAWRTPTPVHVRLELPHAVRHLDVNGLVTRVVRPWEGSGDLHIGVEYTMVERADETVIQKFWMECQRRLRAMSGM